MILVNAPTSRAARASLLDDVDGATASDRAGPKKSADDSTGQGAGPIGPATLRRMLRDHKSRSSTMRRRRSLPERVRDHAVEAFGTLRLEFAASSAARRIMF